MADSRSTPTEALSLLDVIEVQRVARTGRPSPEVELRGETPARPGVIREWIASYWPVRTRDEDELIGVGTVVFEVTERRAAERALRTQTDRYETLLTALSEVGEGMVVIEDDRCVYANAAFEQLSGYTFAELAAMESLFDLGERDARDAEASALFDQSLDEERTLDRVAQLCVRDLADTCVVMLGACR